MKSWSAISLAVLLTFGTLLSVSQPQSATVPQEFRTFHLSAAASQAEQNETITAVRNIVAPNAKVFLVSGQNALVVRAAPEEITLIANILKELDHPRKQYRLTYTLTETDGGKKVGLQHYSMVVTSGQRAQIKEGSRVPLIIGSFNKTDQGTQKETQYLDIGLTFDATLQEYGLGYQLKSIVEQSSIAEEKSGIGPEDPVIRQTRYEGVSDLTEGKPLALGSLDRISSTRHVDIEAVVEPVR